MAGIIPTFKNIGIIIASLYPVFIICFLVLASIFNLKINGLIYLFGVIITFGFCYLCAVLPLGKERGLDTSVTCDFFSNFGYNYPSPSFPVAVTSFTFIYLIIPMFINKDLFNPVVVVTLTLLTIINAGYLYLKECANPQGILVP